MDTITRTPIVIRQTERICAVCGKQFRINSWGQLTCSPKCMRILRAQRQQHAIIKDKKQRMAPTSFERLDQIRVDCVGCCTDSQKSPLDCGWKHDGVWVEPIEAPSKKEIRPQIWDVFGRILEEHFELWTELSKK